MSPRTSIAASFVVISLVACCLPVTPPAKPKEQPVAIQPRPEPVVEIKQPPIKPKSDPVVIPKEIPVEEIPRKEIISSAVRGIGEREATVTLLSVEENGDAGSRQLVFKVRITNTGSDSVEYKPWNAFTVGSRIMDAFTDGKGKFSTQIPRQPYLTTPGTIEAGKSIDDVIAFERPPASANVFMFALPASNLGFKAGYLGFEVVRGKFWK